MVAENGRERPFVVGTRASTLAQVQTEQVIAMLRAVQPWIPFEIKYVRTHGDHDQQTPLIQLGGQGIFVKEIESALQAGEIDLAVHSLKDMPGEQPEGLTIAAILPREDPRDALVSRQGAALEDLPRGARVGTGSLRRRAQLCAYRPDLEIAELRGNVDTRLRKVANGEYDAIVLALAGLLRLGRMDEATEILSLDVMLPAVGQGAICIEARIGDARTLGLIGPLDDPKTRVAVTAERAFLRELGGGCHVPIAAHAAPTGDGLWLRGLVAGMSGEHIIRGSLVGRPERAEHLGRSLACQILSQGRAELLEEKTGRG